MSHLPPPPSPPTGEPHGVPEGRGRTWARAIVASVLVPPVAVIAASTVPSALILVSGRSSWAEAIGGGMVFGTAFGAAVVGLPFWVAYVLAAILLATAAADRRAVGWVFAILAGATGLAAMGVLLARAPVGFLVTRAALASAWCAGVGWIAVRALPRGRRPRQVDAGP